MRRLTKYEILEGIEDVEFSKVIARNTVEYTIANDSKTYIRFCDTDIIVFHSPYVILNSGGFKTKITKNRINEFQNVCHIQQIDSQWFVSTQVVRAINFYDGIKFIIGGRHIQV